MGREDLLFEKWKVLRIFIINIFSIDIRPFYRRYRPVNGIGSWDDL